ncbi:MAG: Fur family transcriptional regulator [Candidatus Auribacterota bacterium]
MNIEQSMALFREKCNQHGLKITPQRTAIFEEMVRAKDHPSTDDLYQRIVRIFPNISFDTVYRTLLSFSQMGIVNVVEGYGEKKRFDPNIETHHHFRCMKCYEIIDFSSESLDCIEIPQELQNRFKIVNKRVVLEGLCDKCRK